MGGGNCPFKLICKFIDFYFRYSFAKLNNYRISLDLFKIDIFGIDSPYERPDNSRKNNINSICPSHI